MELELGRPKQEIGEIVACAGERLAIGIEPAGAKPSEIESAAAVGVGLHVILAALYQASQAVGVFPSHPVEGLVESEALHPHQRGASVAQRREIGEAEIRRPVVQWVGAGTQMPNAAATSVPFAKNGTALVRFRLKFTLATLKMRVPKLCVQLRLMLKPRPSLLSRKPKI